MDLLTSKGREAQEETRVNEVRVDVGQMEGRVVLCRLCSNEVIHGCRLPCLRASVKAVRANLVAL
jgi:hypothetical protein